MSVFLGSMDPMFAFVLMGGAIVGLLGIDFLDSFFGGNGPVDESEADAADSDDPYDAFDDEWDDDWIDEEEPATTTPDLEPRLEDLEEEVDRLSTTVSTVRSENEAVADMVDEIEEHVRKLLGIYEVVSREANPFVEEDEFPVGDSETVGEPTDTGELFDRVSEDLDLDEGAGILGGVDTAGGLEASGESDDSDSMTFEELKAEYQNEPAEGNAVESDTSPDAPAAGPTEPGHQSVGSRTGAADQPDATGGVDNDQNRPGEDESAGGLTTGAREEPSHAESSGPRDPYLSKVPEGYVAEMLVLEWMTYLRSQAEESEVFRSIDYYQRLDWITEPVADRLRTIVEGLHTDPARGPGTESPAASGLSVEDHTRSLDFIRRLEGNSVDIDDLSARLED